MEARWPTWVYPLRTTWAEADAAKEMAAIVIAKAATTAAAGVSAGDRVLLRPMMLCVRFDSFNIDSVSLEFRGLQWTSARLRSASCILILSSLPFDKSRLDCGRGVAASVRASRCWKKTARAGGRERLAILVSRCYADWRRTKYDDVVGKGHL